MASYRNLLPFFFRTPPLASVTAMTVTIPGFVGLIPFLILSGPHFDYAHGPIPGNLAHWLWTAAKEYVYETELSRCRGRFERDFVSGKRIGRGWTFQVKWKGYPETTPEAYWKLMRDAKDNPDILAEIEQCKDDYLAAHPSERTVIEAEERGSRLMQLPSALSRPGNARSPSGSHLLYSAPMIPSVLRRLSLPNIVSCAMPVALPSGNCCLTRNLYHVRPCPLSAKDWPTLLITPASLTRRRERQGCGSRDLISSRYLLRMSKQIS